MKTQPELGSDVARSVNGIGNHRSDLFRENLRTSNHLTINRPISRPTGKYIKVLVFNSETLLSCCLIKCKSFLAASFALHFTFPMRRRILLTPFKFCTCSGASLANFANFTAALSLNGGPRVEARWAKAT